MLSIFVGCSCLVLDLFLKNAFLPHLHACSATSDKLAKMEMSSSNKSRFEKTKTIVEIQMQYVSSYTDHTQQIVP